MIRSTVLLLAAGLLAVTVSRADDRDRLHVGVQPDGRIVVPTNQILAPAGAQITFSGRPVDLALAERGRTLVVKNMRDLVFIDVATAKIKQVLDHPDRDDKDRGFSVVGLLVEGSRIYASDNNHQVCVAERHQDGTYRWLASIPVAPPKVGGVAHPAGLARGPDGSIWVTTTRGNCIQRLNPTAGKVEDVIAVGVSPYMLAWPADPAGGGTGDSGRCFVTNWGGDRPQPDQPQADSSGTPARVDPRTRVGNHGSVSVVGRIAGKWQELHTITVGLHPSGMAISPSGRFLYIANANSDSISVLDTHAEAVVETIPCRPSGALPFGSGSNAVARSPDGNTLYVANGTNNCVAVIELGANARETPGGPPASAVKGLIPTGWYPGAVTVSPDCKKLLVANVKGHGTLSQPRPVARGRNSHDHLGSVSIIDIPDEADLARYTAAVNNNNRLAYSLAGLEAPRAGVAPVPVPERHGEPSVFRHVLYIIKENRTYDQVLGDLREGNGDPTLILFGEDVTPNHHALARQFTLFDNFYCSGVLSADGHSWADAAYVTDYLEKAFGGFARSYPDEGHDPLAFSLTGFLWDNALAHGKTLRNYGEFCREEDYFPKGTTWTDLYNEHRTGKRRIPLTPRPTMKSLEPYTHPTYPYFPLTAPDAYRADLFLEELQKFEQKGELPNLLYMSLPCDHTDGTTPGFPTPRAMVADNDLALGRIVEGISKSRFWKDTCILVVEDDPQDGFDHVDGHRTVALVISPYTGRTFVDSTNYNQTGMVKTIELMLGLPPMNQMDLSATPMRACFHSTADLRTYEHVPNRIPLDEMNPPLSKLKGAALHWARQSLALELDKADKADEDTLNRILWHSVRGYDTPYPEKYVNH
jgi:YVTN family beta-propeller protein